MEAREPEDELECGEPFWECRPNVAFWVALVGMGLLIAVVAGLLFPT